MRRLLIRLDPVLLRVDRAIGGRRAREVVVDTPERFGRPCVRVAAVAAVGVLIAALGVATAGVRTLEHEPVGLSAWWRTLVLMGITTSLLYFTVRVRQGYRWVRTLTTAGGFGSSVST